MNDIDETRVVDDSFLEEDTQKDKYLSFIIDDEICAIEIQFVTEIIGIQKITEVPNSKPYIKGVINLRGNITPVVNVRSRFKIDEIDYTERTCIIVVSINNLHIGLIVDEVSEVINIPLERISPPPHTNKGSKSRYIKGIGKVSKDIIIVLDLSNLLYDEPLGIVVENEE
jgi:purine-binding chemotaxis protein CheW